MKTPTIVLAASLATAAFAADEPAPGANGTGVFGAYAASQQWVMPTDPLVIEKLQRWQDQKLGLLITWGTYSQWGIVESWSLITTRHPWNKRPAKYAQMDDKTYLQTYENLITTFNPVKFDADKWAAAFKDAGIKYVLPMAKHHDGFCMWDTPTTDYKITDPRCPFHADPRADTVKQITAACHKQGLSTGIYFSKADWHSPFYWLPELGPGNGQGPNYKPASQPEKWQQFQEFTWKQIAELMTHYGPQDLLWLDGGAVRPPNAAIDMDGMAAMARKLQPGLIMVDRTVRGPNENIITPENEIPDHYLPYPWETCMTLGNSWSYVPNDKYKSAGTMIRNISRVVARGGNYLIGIGADPNGELDPIVYERFKEIGAWLKLNGEAIYGTRPIKPYEQGELAFTTKADGTVYVIILPKTDNTKPPATVTIPAELTAKAGTITLLGYGELAPATTQDGIATIAIPEKAQANPPCPNAWVVRINRH
jgi:alpha-L-fucosidase